MRILGRGARFTILTAMMLSIAWTVSAHADQGPSTCGTRCGDEPDAGGTGTGTGAGTIVVTHGTSQTVPGRQPKPGSPRPSNYTYVNEYATPTCAGNTLHGNDIACGAAINTCPTPDEVRFWIWHQVVTVTVVPPPLRETLGPWVQLSGTFCLGPDDPGVPGVARVVAAVQAYFGSQTLPLPRWAVRSDPGPRTLINFPTAFSAGTSAAQTIETVILGTAIHITAVPIQWTWYFGDGQTLVTRVPGRAKTDDVTHRYARLGSKTSHVSVLWDGTFRVGAALEAYDLRSPATVTGPASQIAVLQSRAELVAE